MAGHDLNDGQVRRNGVSSHQQGSHHVRSSSHTSVGARRSQNSAATAAKARLAKVMARSNVTDDAEDEDDDDDLTSGPFGSNDTPFNIPRFGGQNSATTRDQSPRVRSSLDDSFAGSRGGVNANLSSSTRAVSTGRVVPPPRISHRPTASLSSAIPRVVEPAPVPIVRDLPPTLPPTQTSQRRPPIDFGDLPPAQPAQRRTPIDFGRSDSSASNGGPSREEATLRDEIDLLREDNENLVSKLRAADERLQELETRNRELEKQIERLGDGISLEAKLLSKKDAILKQREAALKQAQEKRKDLRDDEVAALRLEADAARDELDSATERAGTAEKEVQGLRSLTRRMILTQDEMEEMVLKRCWLARYWGLASRLSVLSEVASSKHERWSAVAPLPLEVVISAGHSGGSKNGEAGLNKMTPSIRDLNDISGEGNVECMLAVEKGLRELALLNVEQGVMLAMAQNHRHLSLERSELSGEEIEDIQFKHAWLVYFWRRAKELKVEKDIADERLAYWMTRSNQSPTSHDVVDVERGLLELHKLGVEEQLWEASRKEVVALAASS